MQRALVFLTAMCVMGFRANLPLAFAEKNVIQAPGTTVSSDSAVNRSTANAANFPNSNSASTYAPGFQAGGAKPRTTADALYSRQTTFMIPFAAETSGGNSVVVQLYFSTDRGAKWQLYASRRPEDKQFQFRAAKDGEYWFASRTVPVADRNKAAEKLAPELVVRVDTAKPVVDFQTNAESDGTISANWKINDDNLAVTTLKIDYQASIGEPWKSVTLRAPTENMTQYVDKVSWTPESAGKPVDVRLEVRDRAGNREIVVSRVTPVIGKGSLNIAAKAKTSIGAAIAAPFGGGAASDQPPADPYAKTSPSNGPQSDSRGITWPSDNRSSTGTSSDPAKDSSKSTQTRTQPDSLADKSYQPVQGETRPPVTQRVDGGESVTGVPPGETPYMTNSKKFNLDYDLETVGPSGVKEVELFGTRDGGQSWSKWGVDDDNQSPFVVQVPEAGMYGFRMVVVAGTGRASTRPRPGDLADIWVGVDLTNPTVRLTSAIYGSGEQLGQLDIHWEANDERLANRPITLYYAEKSDGPWETIAAGLSNTGQHFWIVPPNAPQEVFLKVEARDEAGNLASYVTEKAVSIEALAPQGRIRSVRPATSRKLGAPSTIRR